MDFFIEQYFNTFVGLYTAKSINKVAWKVRGGETKRAMIHGGSENAESPSLIGMAASTEVPTPNGSTNNH
jgi:hypothetical protein